jgi:carbon storage regulator
MLTRKPTESIHIADQVVVTLPGVSRNRVRIGIEAPPEIDIRRTELLEAPPATRDDEALQVGQEVSFTESPGAKGPRAENVKPV